MRKLIFGINITLDGCCDHTKVVGVEEIHEYFTEMFSHADTLVYGRKTYQLMVPFWPDVAKNHSAPTKTMSDFADAFESIDKIIVFSRTLKTVDYAKASIADTDLRDTITKLKQEEGKDILLGGVDVPSQLMELDLIDEFHFVVQPLIVGEGRRLLEGVSLVDRLNLKLVSTKVFKSGSVAVRYVR